MITPDCQRTRRGVRRESWSGSELERLEPRLMLTGDAEPLAATVKAVEAQYEVHQPPRLQLGNAPLAGSPSDRGFDQVELLWQTVPAGDGTFDEFQLSFRRRGETSWQPVELAAPVDIEFEGRKMHSGVITDLAWDTQYEYMVEHLRFGNLVTNYTAVFRTRLQVGDGQPFRFVAYGDSATTRFIDSFRGVQSRINEVDAAFAMLLGDNVYPDGSHLDADGRFSPEINPEAALWNRSHIDYLAVGNHDVDTDPRPTQELYSTPIPSIGSTSVLDVPEGEYPEFNYSFDYGDVHFTVIDSTMTNFVETDEIRARIRSVIDFAVADMAASDARWKIVVAHNPFVGTDKSRHPEEFYFQSLMDGLTSVGVDLVLTGDSHTYSWTYPMVGYGDANGNGEMAFDEIDIVRDLDREYDKDAGLIQLVAGVGGRDYRLASYTEPVFAAGYSLRDFTGPIEFGFAQIDVSHRELVISYISAESGQIVGDTNGNGVEDTDEPHFGRFRIVDRSRPLGDLNGDGQVSGIDIDFVCSVVATTGHGVLDLDFVPDRVIDLNDVSALLELEFGSQAGDVNLDGRFNSSDLVQVFAAGNYQLSPTETPVPWTQGDWNCDGRFDSQDLVWAFQVNRYVQFATPSAA